MRIRGYINKELVFLTDTTAEYLFSTVIHIREVAKAASLPITIFIDEDDSNVVHMIEEKAT